MKTLDFSLGEAMREISDAVAAAIRENKGFVVIVGGSSSDEKHITEISSKLHDPYEILHQVRICSAHKEPLRLLRMLEEYDSIPGALAYIAVAGGTDALSGMLSFNTHRPVISCPPDAPNDSCVMNPPGSSNSYVWRPVNAARFIAQLFSHLPGTAYTEILIGERHNKIVQLQEADVKFSAFPYDPRVVK